MTVAVMVETDGRRPSQAQAGYVRGHKPTPSQESNTLSQVSCYTTISQLDSEGRVVQTTSADSLATVTGFGTTSEDTDQPSARLLTVDVNIISNSQCRSMNSVYGSKVVSTMMCAGVPAGGRDACKRDSGGPLTLGSLSKRRHVLAGITSYGQECGEEGMFGIYSKISFYRDWILHNMNYPVFCSK